VIKSKYHFPKFSDKISFINAYFDWVSNMFKEFCVLNVGFEKTNNFKDIKYYPMSSSHYEFDLYGLVDHLKSNAVANLKSIIEVNQRRLVEQGDISTINVRNPEQREVTDRFTHFMFWLDYKLQKHGNDFLMPIIETGVEVMVNYVNGLEHGGQRWDLRYALQYDSDMNDEGNNVYFPFYKSLNFKFLERIIYGDVRNKQMLFDWLSAIVSKVTLDSISVSAVSTDLSSAYGINPNVNSYNRGFINDLLGGNADVFLRQLLAVSLDPSIAQLIIKPIQNSSEVPKSYVIVAAFVAIMFVPMNCMYRDSWCFLFNSLNNWLVTANLKMKPKPRSTLSEVGMHSMYTESPLMSNLIVIINNSKEYASLASLLAGFFSSDVQGVSFPDTILTGVPNGYQQTGSAPTIISATATGYARSVNRFICLHNEDLRTTSQSQKVAVFDAIARSRFPINNMTADISRALESIANRKSFFQPFYGNLMLRHVNASINPLTKMMRSTQEISGHFHSVIFNLEDLIAMAVKSDFSTVTYQKPDLGHISDSWAMVGSLSNYLESMVMSSQTLHHLDTFGREVFKTDEQYREEYNEHVSNNLIMEKAKMFWLFKSDFVEKIIDNYMNRLDSDKLDDIVAADTQLVDTICEMLSLDPGAFHLGTSVCINPYNTKVGLEDSRVNFDGSADDSLGSSYLGASIIAKTGGYFTESYDNVSEFISVLDTPNDTTVFLEESREYIRILYEDNLADNLKRGNKAYPLLCNIEIGEPMKWNISYSENLLTGYGGKVNIKWIVNGENTRLHKQRIFEQPYEWTSPEMPFGVMFLMFGDDVNTTYRLENYVRRDAMLRHTVHDISGRYVDDVVNPIFRKPFQLVQVSSLSDYKVYNLATHTIETSVHI
jgi:hypothetical protein